MKRPTKTFPPKQRAGKDDAHVGQRVRMRRLELEMSQSALGKELGVTFQQVQKYEKGINRIGAGRLRHLSEILQVPITFFYEGSGNTIDLGPAAVDVMLGTKEGSELAKAFGCITPKQRRLVIAFAQEIAAR